MHCVVPPYKEQCMVQHNGLISDFAFVRCTRCDRQTGLEGFLVSEIACMIMHLHTPGHSVLAVLIFCLFCASGFLCRIMLLSFVFSLCLDMPHCCCTLWFSNGVPDTLWFLNGVPSSLALMWKVMFFSLIKWNFTKYVFQFHQMELHQIFGGQEWSACETLQSQHRAICKWFLCVRVCKHICA